LFYSDATNSTVPTQQDTLWKRYQINSRNGLIATSSTPPELITEKVFFDYPTEAIEWAKSAGEPLAPTDYDTTAAPNGATVAAISSPTGLARVKGTLAVRGNIVSADAQTFTLAYGAGVNPSQWTSILGGDPKARGQNVVLGEWDTTGLDGLYTLRLNITLKDNIFQLYTVQVTVDNKPPTVRVVAPQEGQPIGTSDKAIALEAEAVDNVEVAYVEFYHNALLIDSVKSAPYRSSWTIDSSGIQSFYMIVYDTAGNSVQSDTVQVSTP